MHYAHLIGGPTQGQQLGIIVYTLLSFRQTATLHTGLPWAISAGRNPEKIGVQ